MELGAMVTHPSQSVVSDPGSSVSQCVQAVNSSLVSPACWSAASVDVEEDWPDGWWWYDWESDWMDDWQDDWYWHSSGDCASEWFDDESTCLVCGVPGSSPNLNQQRNDIVMLMIDSGSQSTACSVDFAKGYATDDTERANLWDIQDQKIEAHGQIAESRIPLAFHESRARLLDEDWRFENDDQREKSNVRGSSPQFGCRSAASAGRNLQRQACCWCEGSSRRRG